MRPLTFIAFVGFVLMMAATYCPMLSVFHIATFNVYDMNKPYGMVLLLMYVVGILGTVFNYKITRMAAIISLVLVVLLYLAAVIRVNTTFSFIPFRALASFFAHQIKFKWGWYVLALGQLFALAGIVNPKRKKFN